MRLCYVEDGVAWFTSDFDGQWGDDWNDAPYEHNAGEPYVREGVRLVRLRFESPLATPAEIANGNSRYSVEMINAGAAAWLSAPKRKPIFGGITMAQFIELVFESGGVVYAPLPQPGDHR